MEVDDGLSRATDPIFSIPVWIYITVRRRGGEGDDWTTIRQDIGWQGSDPVYFCGPWA